MEELIKAFQAQMDQIIDDSRRREDRLVAEAKLREDKLLELIEARSVESSSSLSSGSSFRTISVDRPMLLSSSTTSDFITWKEGWDNFALCQHLARQSRPVRVAALKTCLDSDLQRFLIQKTIEIDTDADVESIINALSKYIRAQRNPLLDRIAFYKAGQDSGESFDNFFTRLKEILSACNFESELSCSTCQTRDDDLMRDRVVCGILSDETRHRLLAEENLTLEKAVKICQAEEGAATSQKNLLPKEVCRISSAQQNSHSSNPNVKTSKKCCKCGRKVHEDIQDCPAIGKSCHRCGSPDHFSPCCPNLDRSNSNSAKRIGAIQLS